MRKLLTFSIILFILSACTKNNEYADFHSFKNSEWDKNDVCRFEIEIQDTLTPHYISIIIRHNDNYAYRNLWLFVDITTPSGAIRSDALDCELADDMGNWFGKGISIYKFEALYEQSVIFPKSGIYTFAIRQGMRDDILKNISEVGIKLTKER